MRCPYHILEQPRITYYLKDGETFILKDGEAPPSGYNTHTKYKGKVIEYCKLRSTKRKTHPCDYTYAETYGEEIKDSTGMPTGRNKIHSDIHEYKECYHYLESQEKKVDDKIIKIEKSFMQLDERIFETVYQENNGHKYGRYIVYKDGEINYVDSWRVGELEYTPPNSDIIGSGVIRLPSAAIEYGDVRKLLLEIREFIHKYLETEDRYEKLLSYYILLSWVYDSFTVIPYLRVKNYDIGVGKTRFLNAVGSLLYKGMFTMGASSSAAIFRLIEQFKGSLVMDEADWYKSEMQNEIIKIFNAGFEKGTPVLRVEEQGGKRVVCGYDCFSPKIVAMRMNFKDNALESRFFTLPIKKLTREDIPLELPKQFYKEAQALRDKLLMYRLRNYGRRGPQVEKLNGIEPRLRQVALPLLEVIDDPDVREELIITLNEMQQSFIEEMGASLGGKILATLCDLHESLGTEVYISEIAERIGVWGDKKISERVVGRILKEMGLEREKGSSRNTKSKRFVVWDEKKIDSLKGKYGFIDIGEHTVNETVNIVHDKRLNMFTGSPCSTLDMKASDSLLLLHDLGKMFTVSSKTNGEHLHPQTNGEHGEHSVASDHCTEIDRRTPLRATYILNVMDLLFSAL